MVDISFIREGIINPGLDGDILSHFINNPILVSLIFSNFLTFTVSLVYVGPTNIFLMKETSSSSVWWFIACRFNTSQYLVALQSFI